MLRHCFLSSSCLAVCALISSRALDDPAFADTAADKVGAVGAVNTVATAQVQSGTSQTLMVGAEVFRNQTVRTDAGGLAEIMFTDQSTITVGHGSEVVLDNFVYDADNEISQLAVRLSQGTLRFIGGKISKTSPVKITTPTAALTIRGGIGLFSFPQGRDDLVAFLYGIEITVTGRRDHVTRTIRQPGFGVTVPADGSDPSEPFRLTDRQLANLRRLLESNSTDQGQVPADPLKPVQQFGSKDGFKPDKILQGKDGGESVLKGRPASTTSSSGNTF